MNAARWNVSPDVAARGLGRGAGGMKRVIVIGAGAAGLVAAYELARSGHQPILLEARSRVGGRIYTIRDFAPGHYGELGADRIPDQHQLVIAYCEHFGLSLRPFITGHPRGLLHLDGHSVRVEDAIADPGRLGTPGADREPWSRLWEAASSEIRDAYTGPDAGVAGLSPREYLQLRGYSPSAIEVYGVLAGRDLQLADPEGERFFQITGHPPQRTHEIAGGTELLTDALFRQVARHAHVGAEVEAVVQDTDTVTVHFQTLAGSASVRADYVICALPVPVLATIEFSPTLSEAKLHAFDQLRYHRATRTLLQSRRRFWEHPRYDIVGGATATDLPIRRVVYPSYSDQTGTRGVLIAGDVWDQDARAWQALDPATRVARTIDELSRIHPEIIDDVEAAATWSWDEDRYARGAFAHYAVGQHTSLRPSLVAPEGRILFAGEHCSQYHGWIQGALDSGVRAAHAVHTAPRAAAEASS